jgi:hypothetical protein
MYLAFPVRSATDRLYSYTLSTHAIGEHVNGDRQALASDMELSSDKVYTRDRAGRICDDPPEPAHGLCQI